MRLIRHSDADNHWRQVAFQLRLDVSISDEACYIAERSKVQVTLSVCDFSVVSLCIVSVSSHEWKASC